MSYAMRAAQIDAINTELEDIEYRLDELESMELDGLDVDGEREELEQRKEELEQEKAELSSYGWTAWNNGF